MVARGLTGCSLATLVLAAASVAWAAVTEFQWYGDIPIASLFMCVALPATAALPALSLAWVGWLARRRWPAALGVFLVATWVSAVTGYCWAVARPTGPDAIEELAILRGLGLAAAGLLPGFLGLLTAAVVAVVSPPRLAQTPNQALQQTPAAG